MMTTRLQGRSIVIGLMPLLIPFVAIFGCGLLITVLQSFGLYMFSYTYEDSLFAWRQLVADRWFLQSAGYSLYVAASSAGCSIVLGTYLALQIWKLPLRQQGWSVIYKIPLILPHIAVGFIAVILLSRTGVVSSVAHQIGLIDSFQQFPALLYSSSGFDLISAYIYKETPFVMVMVYGVLCRFDKRRVETAQMLGARPLRIFHALLLPFLLPVLNATFVILFVYSFGGFDLPFVLGDSHPGMLSIRVYEYFFQKDIALRPVAMAMLSVMFLFTMGFIVIYLRIARSMEKEARTI